MMHSGEDVLEEERREKVRKSVREDETCRSGAFEEPSELALGTSTVRRLSCRGPGERYSRSVARIHA